MRTKERLFYWVSGGVLVGIIIGMCISPLTAQNDSFGDITCTGLRVRNPEGRTAVTLGAGDNGGHVNVWGKDGIPMAIMGIWEHGGSVGVLGKDGKVANMSITEDGGFVGAFGKDGKARVSIGIIEDDGFVGVVGKDGTIRYLD